MRAVKIIVAIVVIAAAIAGGRYYLGATGGGGSAAATGQDPRMMAMPVPVAQVVRKTVPIYLEYAARTEAIRSITLQARVPGYLQEQIAADGADVKAGDLLYRIDSRDLQ